MKLFYIVGGVAWMGMVAVIVRLRKRLNEVSDKFDSETETINDRLDVMSEAVRRGWVKGDDNWESRSHRKRSR